MDPANINCCPCTLAPGYDTFSAAGLQRLFDRKKVSHILDFDSPSVNEETAEKFRMNSSRISISGAQFKQSMVLDRNRLRLTEEGETGRYILKPVPLRPPFGKAEELPANEHLTMQIARQAYGITTAECGLVFFRNGEPAFLTRRFDRNRDGSRTAQEDFASLSGRSREEEGDKYRYSGSYEDTAMTMKELVAAYAVEAEKYFERVLFNYLFSNGDAHLKNFSVRQAPGGDYLLSPAYDLVNTRIHIPDDSFFALEDGLFSQDYETESFRSLGFYSHDDFHEFGRRIGLKEARIKTLLHKYCNENSLVPGLISRSFLSEPVKDLYLRHYRERLKMLDTSIKSFP